MNGNDAINNPPEAHAYAGLRTGSTTEVEWEANQATPIDGSDGMLRLLSPFIIRVEPPLILADQPSTLGIKTGNLDVGVYGRNARTSNGFTRSRAALDTARYVTGFDWGVATPQEWIAKGSGGRVKGASFEGGGASSSRGPVEAGNLGVPSIADLHVAVDIASQLATVAKTPPLVLLINPTSLRIAIEKIQQHADRTRYGNVMHAWGDGQPKLSISAKCGAFISGGRGVQMASRRDSAAWQNLMTAFQFFKNNGYIHDTVGRSNAFHMVGALSISYDQWTYYGHMESFDWSFDETTQKGGVDFTIEFVASAMTDGAEAPFGIAPRANPGRGDSALPASSVPAEAGLVLGGAWSDHARAVSPASVGGPATGGGGFVKATVQATRAILTESKPKPFKGNR